MSTVTAPACQSGLAPPTAWRLLLQGPLSAQENMRRDEQALEGQKSPTALPAVRLYRWARPAVSFGRLQQREAAEAVAAARGTREIVRRPTGGGVVYHDEDLSFSVAWRRDPPVLPSCVKTVYRQFHQALAEELSVRGFPATLQPSEGSRRGAPGACYEEFSEGDVLSDGKKWVGGALKIASWGRLYQGNLKPPAAAGGQPGKSDGTAAREDVDWITTVISAFETRVFGRPPLGASPRLFNVVDDVHEGADRRYARRPAPGSFQQ